MECIKGQRPKKRTSPASSFGRYPLNPSSTSDVLAVFYLVVLGMLICLGLLKFDLEENFLYTRTTTTRGRLVSSLCTWVLSAG